METLFKDLESPCGVADFKAFLHGQQAELEESLRAIVPSDVAVEVGLSDGSWIERIGGDESKLSLAEAEVSSDYKQVKELEKPALNRGDIKRQSERRREPRPLPRRRFHRFSRARQ